MVVWGGVEIVFIIMIVVVGIEAIGILINVGLLCIKTVIIFVIVGRNGIEILIDVIVVVVVGVAVAVEIIINCIIVIVIVAIIVVEIICAKVLILVPTVRHLIECVEIVLRARSRHCTLQLLTACRC